MWRYLVPIGVFAALFVFFFVGLGRDKETLPSPLIGKPAPTFELARLDGQGSWSTQEMAGRPYLLNVWGSWCVACRQEHEALMAIARRGEVPIVGLNWNDSNDAAIHWLQTLGNPYVVTPVDSEGRVAIDFGVYAAPETFLIDSKGLVVYKHVGALDMQVWEQQFVPRIKSDGARIE
jgi:cytochrome c biogenesis protein CcmG, thiol:disulfide interchange protein DsbE